MDGDSGYEFMLIDLPIKKPLGGNKPIEAFMAQLNALGAEGWQVVIPMRTAFGGAIGNATPAPNVLLLQRRRSLSASG